MRQSNQFVELNKNHNELPDVSECDCPNCTRVAEYYEAGNAALYGHINTDDPRYACVQDHTLLGVLDDWYTETDPITGDTILMGILVWVEDGRVKGGEFCKTTAIIHPRRLCNGGMAYTQFSRVRLGDRRTGYAA